MKEQDAIGSMVKSNMGRVSLIGELGLVRKVFLEDSIEEGKHGRSGERRKRRTLKIQDIVQVERQRISNGNGRSGDRSEERSPKQG